MEDRRVECAHCGRPFPVVAGVGRPRKYCKRSCRQRAFEVRRQAEDQAWGDQRLIRSAQELAELEDRLDEAAQVVRDLHDDLDDDAPAEIRQALERIERSIAGTR